MWVWALRRKLRLVFDRQISNRRIVSCISNKDINRLAFHHPARPAQTALDPTGSISVRACKTRLAKKSEIGDLDRQDCGDLRDEAPTLAIQDSFGLFVCCTSRGQCNDKVNNDNL